MRIEPFMYVIFYTPIMQFLFSPEISNPLSKIKIGGGVNAKNVPVNAYIDQPVVLVFLLLALKIFHFFFLFLLLTLNK